MSHRRSSSLSGSTRVADLQPEPPPPPSSHQSSPRQEGRRAPPRKALSVDTGKGAVDQDEEYYSGRRGGPPGAGGRPLEIASAALTTIGNKSEEFIQLFDEKCDDIENGPIAQSAKATAHRAAEVIEEKVLKHVKLPEEVYEVLHEIEKTQAYQAARCGVNKAYSYVEPILSRVNSGEEEEQVEFVIPPHLENQFIKNLRGADSPKSSRPYDRSFELDSEHYQPIVDPRDSLPEIKISDETGRSSIVSLNTGSLLKERAPDTLSLVSMADSERQYEIIRPNKFYKTPPLPKPVPRKRRSLLVKCGSNETRTTSLPDVDEEDQKDIQRRLAKSVTLPTCECPQDARTPQQPLGAVGTKGTGTAGGSPKRGTGAISSSSSGSQLKKLQRQETIGDNLGGPKLMRSSNFEISDGSREDEPLMPWKTKIKGIPEEELKERLKDKLDSVVCINGKTYIIHQRSSEQDKKEREKYGGASEFFEESIGFTWEDVTGINSIPSPYSHLLYFNFYTFYTRFIKFFFFFSSSQ